MSLYEGAVKKPIMTSLCFLAVAIFGDDFLCGSQCVGY